MQIINLKGGLHTLVDDDDFTDLNLYKWWPEFHGKSYRVCRGTSKGGRRVKIYMHRSILKCEKGQFVDHIDGDSLNNQKSNLRFCTHQQNCFNRSSRKNSSSCFLGVSRQSGGNKWIAQLEVRDKNYYIGLYSDEIEAALAYNVAASFAFREFARLNVV